VDGGNVGRGQRRTDRLTTKRQGDGEVQVQVFDLEDGYLLGLVGLHRLVDVVEHVQHVDQPVTADGRLAAECLAQVVGEQAQVALRSDVGELVFRR